MTLPQFIVHLKQQPWELDYVSNILSQHTRLLQNTTVAANSFINIFTWSKSLNKPVDFWRGLHYMHRYRTVGIITVEDIIQRIKYEYKDSHPELLI